jgi:hypothetical protein
MGAGTKIKTCLDMSQFFSIFGRAPTLSHTHKFPQKMTPNGHFSTKFHILNVSNFLASVTHGNFFAERTLNTSVRPFSDASKGAQSSYYHRIGQAKEAFECHCL